MFLAPASSADIASASPWALGRRSSDRPRRERFVDGGSLARSPRVLPAFLTLSWVKRVAWCGLVSEPPRSDGAWTYWRPDADGVVEMGAVAGHDVALPAHFHVEHQLTFVLCGRRRFVVGERAVVVSAGAAAWIPARVPHHSMAEPAGVECVNVYVRAGEYDAAAIVRSVELQWLARGRLEARDLAGAVQRHRLPAVAEPAPCPSGVLRRHARVAEAAAHAGLSREGYSRAFAARYGMPPPAYTVLDQGTGPWWDTVRSTLDSWFIRLPAPARAQVGARFADAHLAGAVARRGVAP